METNYSEILNGLKFDNLIPVRDIIGDINRVPKSSGVYFWLFQNIPSIIPADECFSIDDTKLLYIGISPRNKNGNATLWNRMQMHLGNNADISTLRVSLGSILFDELKLELKPIGDNKFNFNNSEGKLTDWMRDNAFLYFCPCEQPWKIEVELIKSYSLPLNIQHNYSHPFCKTLRELRAALRERAKELPIILRNP